MITERSEDSYIDWLYLQRGYAKHNQCMQDIDGALEDYRKVAARLDQESVEQDNIEEALYSIGFCHYLRSEMTEAET